MMTFEELLLQNEEGIVQRWLKAALSTYAADASAAFARQKDPFANPVGHSLRVGTRAIYEAVLGQVDSAELHQHLHDIISIRAVQEFSASQSLAFIFALKKVVRDELGGPVQDPKFAEDLDRLDGRIDQIALAAFDVFVECRERVYELRVNEAKRRVSWVVSKLNAKHPDSEPAQFDREVTAPGEGG